MAMCDACPFNMFTETAANAQNLGCLPQPIDNINHFDKLKVSLACHEDDNKHCTGLLEHRPEAKNYPVVAYDKGSLPWT